MAVFLDYFGLSPSIIYPSFVLVGFVIYWSAWIIYTRFFHPLSKIPGPFLATVSRAWIPLQALRGDMDQTQRDFHEKHGPLMRIAPNEIACADPAAIKLVYPIRGPWTKTDFYSAWHNKGVNPRPDHFANTNERSHSAHRRKVQNIYGLSNVLKSEQHIDNCSSLFIQRMGEYADVGTKVDLGHWLQWYAFDIIGEIFFGRMFGFMEKRQDHARYIESLDTLLPIMLVSATSASYARPFIMASSLLSASVRRGLKAFEHIGDAARTCVAQRLEDLRAGKDTREDLLAQFLKLHQQKGKEVDFTIQDVRLECYGGLFAGSDTTAIALRSIFYYLMKTPTAYETLQKELDDATAADKLSSPIKYAEAIKLPYLDACVKEAMRLHPSVGFTMPRIVPKGGVMVAGQHIPAGYNIGLNGAVVHYDKNIFGSDSYDFNPSRWLNRDAAQMDRHLITFGAGTRTCIGKNISLSEIYKLVPEVLRQFSITLAEPQSTWHTTNQWFNKQTNLHVYLKRR